MNHWNGSSWTEVGDLNTARAYMGADGTQYICFSFWRMSSSFHQVTANAELWNGTSWSETTDLNTARTYLANGGAGANNTAGLALVVAPGSDTGATEEFITPTTNTVTFTVS